MINYQNLNVEYDSVIIFDLLSQNERDKYNVSSSLEELFKRNNTYVTVKYFSNKKEIIAYLEKLLADSKSGKKFMFHFVGHGNKQCLAFKHLSESITWEELTTILTEINEATGNTLVLNMTSCFGLHGIKTVNPFSNKSPFFGLIGYDGELEIKAAKQANDIFYSSMFKGFTINQAVDVLKTKMNDKNFHCISSQGFSYIIKIKKSLFIN